MDILGPFPKATGQRKYLFVAVDYLTKWMEAEAVASITAIEVRRFSSGRTSSLALASHAQ